MTVERSERRSLTTSIFTTKSISNNEIMSLSEAAPCWNSTSQIQYNTIQILLSTLHGGFSETITKNRNNNNEKKGTQRLSINIVKNYLHIKFMTLKIDLKGRKTIYI